ncbi:4-alpha-glucanotransferase [Edwardsiella ictaluri]|uniref:4-alpha-glucanotransferase n=1 Tax=Edwardsiella ictaluri TaxID=67780 RepID=UPI000DFCD50E|nr:4-alpha-glucanotransferase [Edwardsiella ictaluri]STP85465.1 4-alpha-glucanotransferase [Edwardsiella ictaluri]
MQRTTPHTALEQQAAQAGIADSYINAHGRVQAISAQTKRRLLDAMPPRTPSDAPLPAVLVAGQRSTPIIDLRQGGHYHWSLTLENGTQPAYQGRLSRRKHLVLPHNLPLGYHSLQLSDGQRQWQCRIIIAPARCHEPDALLTGRKLWGACVQLYTLRSAHNWGIGDFGDLAQLIGQIALRGGAFVGLNPIHALYPANPHSISPYSPSSRRWLNIIYIDINQVDEFQRSTAAQRWWQKPSTRQRLDAARASTWVDYPAVYALKLEGLRLAFHTFNAQGADARAGAFRHFVCQGGDSLRHQAAFDALHSHLYSEDKQMWGWPVWPPSLRRADSPEVARFCQQYPQEVTFFLWLQWLADSQLADCYQQACCQAMPIGLYRDLAVGVAEGGAETWSEPELYCLRASVGAPPDILGPLGQNWGLPPMDPHTLRDLAYQPFVDMLRANMRHCGALRIDHVMSLLRLWWIPQGQRASEGSYVGYPLDDLLTILALESQRSRCMVIGEDLGTVPVEIIAKLREYGVYSYKVLYFEHDSENTFRAPQTYNVQAMATVTTHDLPTLNGYWQADDLRLGERLGLYPYAEVLAGLYRNRAAAKQGLLDGLHHYDCLPQRSGRHADRMAMTPVLNRGIQRYVADSASALLGLQPEDWLNMAAPVNVPGTCDEYPNWRRKLSMTLEDMFNNTQINELISDLDKRRKKVSAG